MRVNATFVHPRGRNANAIIGTMSTTNQVVLPKIAQERMKRLETRTAKIGVIGLGYVGLPLSLLLSEAGFKVTGFDIDTKKVTDLEVGLAPYFQNSGGRDPERAEAGLYGHSGLRWAVGAGCHHYVRANAADGAS